MAKKKNSTPEVGTSYHVDGDVLYTTTTTSSSVSEMVQVLVFEMENLKSSLEVLKKNQGNLKDNVKSVKKSIEEKEAQLKELEKLVV